MQKDNHTPSFSQTSMLELFGQAEVFGQRNEIIVSQTGWRILYYSPMPAPRPRATTMPAGFDQNGQRKYRATVYNPTNYKKWKQELATLIRYSNIKKDEYNQVDMLIGIALKKSYTKKDKARLIYTLHDKKPDYDNFEKGVLDAIQDSGKIENDSLFGSGSAEKIWIGENEPEFIMFNLKKRLAPVRDFRKIIKQAKLIGDKSKELNNSIFE